jgi:Leucine Rich repeat
MTNERPSRRNLDSLKKEAKRWLAALRRGDAAARRRFDRGHQDAPEPTLRDVQHALAREHGFPGWTDLKRAHDEALERDRASSLSLPLYERMAEALLEAYRTGSPEAMARHYQYTWHRRAWPAMRAYVQLDLGKRSSGHDGIVDITIDDARHLVAIEHGFDDWHALRAFMEVSPAGRLAARPVRAGGIVTRDWSQAIQRLAENPSASLDAHGQMTDDILRDICRIEGIASLNLAGSKALTDSGVDHLARASNLQQLDLSGTRVTDRGLRALAELKSLQTLSLAGTRVTDEGIAHLRRCHDLQRVNLSNTAAGDGALRALAGKPNLRYFASGGAVTDAGLALLHEFPIFKSWHGGEPRIALLSYSCEPNQLMLRGTFTDNGLQCLRGLDGLFGLNLDDSALAISAAGLSSLAWLPNLGWLAVDARDDWMPHIAALPGLRFLGAQDTVAGDDGFRALSRSRSIEYIWGRRCHNLGRRGFVALAEMPSLRALSVSCLNVDDDGVSALPRFPALRELMPMDVPDAGYRHIGRCERLESLVLMYCRDTTDEATEHITALRHLTYYFNSYTTITDRTPELLSTMDSLEQITFDTCHGLSDAGVTRLARLPRLRELRVSGRGITAAVRNAFPPQVVSYGD